MKWLVTVIIGLLIGIFLGYVIVLSPVSVTTIKSPLANSPSMGSHPEKQVVGFLPYWLLGKAKNDYSSQITQLSYFSLSIDTDGHLKKLNSPIEEEPGWYTLRSGKMDDIFATARKKKVQLSITVFSGDDDTINEIMADPLSHAQNLVSDVLPLMKTYRFSNLNLDIEKVTEASASSQQAFIDFAREVKSGLVRNRLGTLTVDISASDLIKKHLIVPSKIAQIADYILLMGYDFHFIGSSVTGPVAPLYGAGVISEYDTNAAVEKALASIPPEKIILGIPDYGYEWETINTTPRSAVIPGTGLTASSRRVEDILSNCSNCQTGIEQESEESYVIFKDDKTNTFHQLFYPTEDATKAKVQYAQEKKLGGLAVWALGYEGTSTLSPLASYLSQ